MPNIVNRDFYHYRYAEKHSVLGLVLVSACITDLGDPNEKASGEGFFTYNLFSPA